MKLEFDSNLTYLAEAVKAVVDVFEGQPLSQIGFEVSFTEQVGMVEQTELGLGNRLTLDDDQLLANVHEVQTRNEIEPVDELKGRPDHLRSRHLRPRNLTPQAMAADRIHRRPRWLPFSGHGDPKTSRGSGFGGGRCNWRSLNENSENRTHQLQSLPGNA